MEKQNENLFLGGVAGWPFTSQPPPLLIDVSRPPPSVPRPRVPSEAAPQYDTNFAGTSALPSHQFHSLRNASASVSRGVCDRAGPPPAINRTRSAQACSTEQSIQYFPGHGTARPGMRDSIQLSMSSEPNNGRSFSVPRPRVPSEAAPQYNDTNFAGTSALPSHNFHSLSNASASVSRSVCDFVGPPPAIRTPSALACSTEQSMQFFAGHGTARPGMRGSFQASMSFQPSSKGRSFSVPRPRVHSASRNSPIDILGKGISLNGCFWIALAILLTSVFNVDGINVAREELTRPGTFFYHINDGYHYHLNREEEGSRYYKCVLAARGCQGRAVFDPIDGFFHSNPHAHEPDRLYPDEVALRRAILNRCRQLEYVAFRTILDQELHWFPAAVGARVTFGRMRTPMRHARLQQFPPQPANLRDLTNILMNDQYRVITQSDDGLDNLYAGSVDDVDGGHHIVFISERQLERMRNMFVLHSDGTFMTVPVSDRFAEQVFVIVGVWRHHILYFGWSLMASRTQHAYEAVLDFVRHLLGPNIALTRVISDFETGQQNAWQAIFGIAVQGCLWHLCRAYMENVAENNLIVRMTRIPEVRNIIRLTLALPLLPANLIVTGYELIVRHAREEGMYIFRIVRPYLMFVWRYWVSRPWRRERMCVFGSSQRTNNCCESHNRVLRQTVGTHPNVYRFIQGLVTLEQRCHRNFLALEAGNRPNQSRRRTSIMNDRRIEQLAEDLFHPPGPIDQHIFNFLRHASHLMDGIVQEAIEARRNRRH